MTHVEEMGSRSKSRHTEPDPPPPAALPPKRPLKPLKLVVIATNGLFLLALFYTFYFAREFFLPLTLGVMLNFVLKPVVGALKKLHVPEAIGAGVVLTAVVALLVGGVLMLSEPAAKWMSPESIKTAEQKIRNLMGPATKLTAAAEQVDKLATGREEGQKEQTVVVKKPGLVSSVLSRTKGFLFTAGTTFVFLYFLLASGDSLIRNVIQVLPRFQDKKKAYQIATEAQHQISAYLFALTLLNIWEGAVVGLGLWLVGMPNPVLWGVVIMLVNYVPYLGAVIAMGIVTLVAFVTFDSLPRALLPGGIYLAINVLDNFLGPYFFGKRLTLDPVVVFVALMLWGVIWGPIGVLLAVPLLMIVKIFFDHSQKLKGIGDFMAGGKREEELAANAPAA